MNGISSLSRRAGLIWLLLILGVASFLRLWQIGVLPPGFHLDESFEGLEALRMLSDSSYRPIFVEGNFGLAPLNIWVNALSFTVAGWFGVPPGPTVMRVTAACFGILGVAALWWLAHELALHNQQAPRPVALTAAFPLFAAAALAGLRWHVHFSRMGIEPIFMPLGWALATALLLHGMRTGRWAAFVGLGLTLAAIFYSYQGAWLIPFIVGATALGLLVRAPGASGARPQRVAQLALAGGVALLLVAPLLLYLLRHPDLALLRPAQISVVGATASPADSSVLTTTVQTLAMFWPFGATGDLDPRRNLPGAPALPLLPAPLFFAGVALSLRRLRRPLGWIPLLGLLGLLVVGFVSEFAPHFHRVLGAAAPAALLIGLGADALAQATHALLGRLQLPAARRRAAAWILPALLLLGAAGVGARDYFVRWAALPDLFHAFDVGLWQAGQWMAAQPAAEPLYLTPRSTDHPTLAFALARPAFADASESVQPIAFDGRHLFPLTDGAAPTVERYLVIEHEDFRTPLLLPQLLPNATATQSWQDAAGAPYATVWERPAGSRAARPPQVALERSVGDGFSLLGYDLQPAAPKAGETLYLQLHWRVDAAPAGNWTVFTHLLGDDPGAPPLAGKDSVPGAGSLPTLRWQPGWRILDEYQIALPADLAPGAYGLAVGLYTADGARLPAEGAIALGAVEIANP